MHITPTIQYVPYVLLLVLNGLLDVELEPWMKLRVCLVDE